MKPLNMKYVALVDDFTPVAPAPHPLDRAILDARRQMDNAGSYERFRNAQADYSEAVQAKKSAIR